VNLAHDSHDGYSRKDITGHNDAFTSNSQNVKFKIKPLDNLRFNVEATSSRNDVRYLNPLTREQFKQDPRQNGGKAYTHQSFDSDQWRIGAEYDLNSQFRIAALHYQEDKFSEFVSSNPSSADSLYKGNDISLRYQNEFLSLIGGYQDFDGERKSKSNFFGFSSSDNTTKKTKHSISAVNIVWTH